MIIGFCGKMGAGKDTAGAYLVEKYGFERISFADKLKVSAAACFGIPYQLWEELKVNPEATITISEGSYDSHNKWTVTCREFLQRYGTEAHRNVFGTDFWVDEALKDIEAEKNYVITDVRFDNEALAVHDYGGLVIQIHRDGDVKDAHPSEAGLSAWLVDGKVANIGSIEQLHVLLDALVERANA